jgi:hypothetical protein
MKTNLIITDNFYGDPDSVRNFALAQEFSLRGNFPGMRTKTFLNQSIKDAIQSIIWNAAGEVTNWFEQDGLSGSFELATSKDRSWVHTDHYNTWAGVCYLTPDAPLSSGTGLFQYKKNGARVAEDLNEPHDAQDMTKWQLCDVIANRYNRIAIYRSNQFHTSLDYFGSDLQTGRLFQLFFFSTQY